MCLQLQTLWRLSLLCILLALIAHPSFTQSIRPLEQVAGSQESALSKATIKAIAQASGEKYVLTDKGLCYRFSDTGAETKIASPIDRKEHFDTLLAAPDGVYLLVNHCELRSLTNIEGKASAFTTTRFSTTVQPTVTLLSSKGDVFVGTQQDGVFLFSKDAQGAFLSFPTRLSTAGGILPGNAVLSLCEDSQGVIWIGTNQGLATWSSGIVTNLAAMAKPEKRRRLRELPIPTYRGPVYHIVQWGSSILFTDGQNLYTMAKDASQPAPIYKHKLIKDDEKPAAQIQQLMVDMYGYIWIAHQQLIRYNLTTGETTILSREQGLRGTGVSTLLEDVDDFSIWVGTMKGGIYVLDNDLYQQIGH